MSATRIESISYIPGEALILRTNGWYSLHDMEAVREAIMLGGGILKTLVNQQRRAMCKSEDKAKL